MTPPTFAYIDPPTVPPGQTLREYARQRRRLSRWRLWRIRFGGVC